MVRFKSSRSVRTLGAGLAVGAAAVALAACGGSSSSSSSTANAGAKTSSSSNAAPHQLVPASTKTINPGLMNGAKGQVTYCVGGASTADVQSSINAFNKTYKSQGLSAKIVLFPSDATTDFTQYVQRLQAHSSECDVIFSDVVWTATFASQGWLYNVTPYIQQRASQFLPATLDTAHYAGNYWAVPQASDAAFIYYRKDQVKTPPTSWQQLYADAARTHGYVYQGEAYEGTTCDFLEMAYAAGGQVLNTAGTKSVIDSPQNIKALTFMVDGIKDGAAPKAVTTYEEPQALQVFDAGKATFMRNWTYAYALNEQAPAVRGKVGVIALPEFQGGTAGQILGGHNDVIPADAANPGGALKLIDFMTDEAQEAQRAIHYTDAPVLDATYSDPAVKQAMPFLPELLQAIEHGHARPVTANYTAASEAIYNNVNAALSGSVTPSQALANAQTSINKALSAY